MGSSERAVGLFRDFGLDTGFGPSIKLLLKISITHASLDGTLVREAMPLPWVLFQGCWKAGMQYSGPEPHQFHWEQQNSVLKGLHCEITSGPEIDGGNPMPHRPSALQFVALCFCHSVLVGEYFGTRYLAVTLVSTAFQPASHALYKMKLKMRKTKEPCVDVMKLRKGERRTWNLAFCQFFRRVSAFLISQGYLLCPARVSAFPPVLEAIAVPVRGYLKPAGKRGLLMGTHYHLKDELHCALII